MCVLKSTVALFVFDDFEPVQHLGCVCFASNGLINKFIDFIEWQGFKIIRCNVANVVVGDGRGYYRLRLKVLNSVIPRK